MHEQPHGRPSRGGRVAHTAARIVVALLVSFTAVRLSGWHAEIYPLPALLAFTPYAAASGALLAAALLARSHRRLASLAGACSLALVLVIAPRLSPAAPPEPTAAGHAAEFQVRVTTLNTLWGDADMRDLARLLATTRSDIVALQEVERGGLQQLREAGLLGRYPHRVIGGLRTGDDSIILSTWPARRANLNLPREYLPAAITTPGGRQITITSAHPLPPVGPARQDAWVKRLAELPSPTQWADPAILAGDFNATLDHAQFRDVLNRGWRDVAKEQGKGLQPTWHGLPLLRLTIDHVLAAPAFRIHDYRVDQIDGTDHRAVTATLTLPR